MSTAPDGSVSMIADAVDRLLADAAPAPGHDARLWTALADAGVPRLLRPESEGGAGPAWRDAAQVLERVGAHAAGVPLADALIGHALLSAVGIDVDDRPLRLSIAGPDGRPDPGDMASAADAASLARAATGVHRLLVDGAWGARPTGRWQPADGGERMLEFPATVPVRAAIALAAAAMLVGAMRAAIAMGVDYAGLRRAFGRPIGQFQAVQHPLAVATEDLAASRAALWWASSELEDGRGESAAAIAKARAADAAGRVAAIVHQVHGAIGFTAEHPLHRTSRVLWTWRDRWGDEQDWQALLGARALEVGGDGLLDLLDGSDVADAVPTR